MPSSSLPGQDTSVVPAQAGTGSASPLHAGVYGNRVFALLRANMALEPLIFAEQTREAQ